MMFQALWNNTRFETLPAALVNHLWQSTLVAAIAWLLALALKQNQARIRYWVWMIASLKFVVPFSIFIAAGEWLRSLTSAPLEKPALAAAMEQIAQPFSEAQSFSVVRHSAVAHRADLLPALLLAMWSCGSLFVLLRWIREWRRIRAAVRAASPLAIAADVPALASATRLEPGIFGVFRPVLLLPQGILDRLTPAQLSAIVAHEMCHVRRRDNLTYAAHMLVETLFWFHPLVWWIGGRLVEERERACDEAVLQKGNEAEVYAESILKVCKFYFESPLACVSGVGGSDLKRRISLIMTAQVSRKLDMSRRVLLAGAATAFVAAPFAAGLVNNLHPLSAQLLHATGTTAPSFEVATIKPNKEERPGPNIQFSPANFVARHSSFKDLIKIAYHVKSDDQLAGTTSWMNSEFFDIQAKASESEIAELNKLDFQQRMEQSQMMLQSLLADRFQLKVSFRTEELPVYGLVVAKGGSRLKEVELSPFPPPGTPPPPGAHLPRIGRTGPNQYTASAWPMNGLADWLSHFDELGNRVVIDETGFKGNYDFVLNGISMGPLPPPDPNGPTTEQSITSIFTALQEQLGLKLEPRKAPVEVLVIDHAEQPSPN